jgi:hypothetical protein
MSSKNLILNKLGFSGKLMDVSTLNPLSLFGPTSIIPIYDKKSKILYTWIGDKAPQSLRNYIPEIRKILMEKYPQNSILRYVTVDAYSEPFDFLKLLDIEKVELENQLKNLERKRIAIIGDIDQLKVKENNLLITNKFDEAVKIAEEIIELAEELNDMALQEEQKEYIRKIQDKQKKSRKISFIKDLTVQLSLMLENVIKSEDIIKAHEDITEFREDWGDIIKMFKIESAISLIRKEKEIWNHFVSSQQQKLDQISKEISEINNALQKAEVEEFKEDILCTFEKAFGEATYIETQEEIDEREKYFEDIGKESLDNITENDYLAPLTPEELEEEIKKDWSLDI